MFIKRGDFIVINNDPENFFFFIKENPIPFETYRRFRKEDKKKTQEEINRQYENNLRWADKILKQLIIISYLQQKELTKKIRWIIVSKQSWGLDVWM